LILICGLILSSCIALFFYNAREFIAYAYTNIEVLSIAIADTLTVVAVEHFFQSVNLWLKGIIIALGKFSYANIGLFFACYIIAIPLGCYLALSL
jgi:Na+-driven multidrug efflux pump